MLSKITVCGNISSGKTSLTSKLATMIPGSQPVFISNPKNPISSHLFNKYSYEFLGHWSKNGNTYNPHAYPMLMKFFLSGTGHKSNDEDFFLAVNSSESFPCWGRICPRNLSSLELVHP